MHVLDVSTGRHARDHDQHLVGCSTALFSAMQLAVHQFWHQHAMGGCHVHQNHLMAAEPQLSTCPGPSHVATTKCIVSAVYHYQQQSDAQSNAMLSLHRVANYIFGGNTSVTSDKASSEKVAMTAPVITQQQPASSEKIAMTAPVATSQQEASSGAYTLSFVMPSKYTMDTLPQPKDASVVLKQVPGYLAASLQFAGRVDADVEVRKREQELLTIIKVGGGMTDQCSERCGMQIRSVCVASNVFL